MKKSSVYTRTGDKGETSLVSGARISKGNSQIDLYGEVDELNSHLGFFLALVKEESLDCKERISKLVIALQNELFNLGSLLACEPENWEKYKLVALGKSLVIEIEKEIDLFDSELPELKNFILPGGAKSAAYSHIIRSTSRRVERELIAYQKSGRKIPANSVEILNRVSDLFFIISRTCNKELNITEVIWKKD